jgi:hypothetical protein
MRDLKSNILAAVALLPAVHADTKADAPVLDLQGAGSATIVISTGAIVAAGLFVAKLVHGDAPNLSDATDVAADDLLGAFPAALAADSVYSVGYRGGKRYVRVVLTKTSGTSLAAGAVLIKGHLTLTGAV